MKTPQVPAMPGMSPLGFRKARRDAIAQGPLAALRFHVTGAIERGEWQKPKLAPAPQQACDIGLFGDAANQTDLIDMLRNPTARGK